MALAVLDDAEPLDDAAMVGSVASAELRVDPAQLETGRIEVQLRTYSAASAAAMCRMLLLVAEYDRREAYTSWECLSCARWLELHCHVAAKTARDWVRVARALEGLPLTIAAFSAGLLTYSKVRALTRVATDDNEETLVELAKVMPASRFEEAIRAIERTLRGVSKADEKRIEELRGAERHDNGDGTITWSIRVDVEEDELIQNAIAHARDDDFDEARREATGGDQAKIGKGRGLGLPRVDALLRALELSVDVDADAVVPSRYLTIVNVSEGYGSDDDGLVTMGNGLRLHPRMAARLGCDTSMQLVERGSDGGVRMGRRTRTFTAKQRDLIADRFATCGFPGCAVSARRCQFHHIRHWTDGGLTDVDNGVPLCRRHHRSVHEGGWRLWRNQGNEIVAVGPDGRRLMRKLPAVDLGDSPGSALLTLLEASGIDVERLEQPERCGPAVVAEVATIALGNHEIGRFPLLLDGRRLE